uniref:Uncharacterized protein n=1 Tax=Ciona savignyi TaxID=51511 RepID=H2YQL9_CIOSA
MYLDPKEYEEMVDQLKLLTVVVQQRTDELEELKSLFEASSIELDEKKGQLSVLTNALDVMETKLNEESYVKAAYKEHGGKVLTQASQILATAENVTNEIQKVHNKVERAQSVNRDNQQSTSAFAVSIQENIDCFISSTMQVYETNMSSMDQIHTGLGKVLEQKHESVSEIKRKMSSFQEHVATACQDNQEFQLELSAKLDEEADNTEEKTSDLMVLVQTQAERSQSMLDEAKLISDNVLELLAITEQSYNLQTKLTEQMVNVFATSKSNVESNLKTLSSLTDQLVKKQKDQLAEMQEAVCSLCLYF